MGPGNTTVAERDVFQVGEMGHARVLAIRHVGFDVHDDGIFQLDGVIVFLGAGRRSAVPFDYAFT